MSVPRSEWTGGFTNCWDLGEVHSSVFQARRADISNATWVHDTPSWEMPKNPGFAGWDSLVAERWHVI